MKLSEVCRFFITIPGQSQVQIYPTNETLEFEEVKDKTFKFWRRELTSDIIIKNLGGHNTFNDLYLVVVKVPFPFLGLYLA